MTELPDPLAPFDPKEQAAADELADHLDALIYIVAIAGFVVLMLV